MFKGTSSDAAGLGWSPGFCTAAPPPDAAPTRDPTLNSRAQGFFPHTFMYEIPPNPPRHNLKQTHPIKVTNKLHVANSNPSIPSASPIHSSSFKLSCSKWNKTVPRRGRPLVDHPQTPLHLPRASAPRTSPGSGCSSASSVARRGSFLTWLPSGSCSYSSGSPSPL